MILIFGERNSSVKKRVYAKNYCEIYSINLGVCMTIGFLSL